MVQRYALKTSLSVLMSLKDANRVDVSEAAASE